MTSSQDSQTPEMSSSPFVLDQSAADMRQCRKELLQKTPGTLEYDKAKFQYDQSGARFIETFRRTTKYEKKFQPQYHLSSGQIAEAKSEYVSAMDERVLRVAMAPPLNDNANLKHYTAKITTFVSKDACIKVAKGKKIAGNLCFPEISSDAPINANDGELKSIVDELDDGARNDNLLSNEIRDASRKITLKTRKDISLWDILELKLQGFSMKEIGRKLGANPDILSSFIHSDRVKDYMKPFLTLSLLVFLFIATEYR